jgi:serine/threonine-protein kinase PpkA
MAELEIPGLTILDEIGRGGMARVYLALQNSLQRPVAVKVLNQPETSEFHDRYLIEGRYIAALSHSNIVEIYDVGESNGYYYLVMEYLPGGDLKGKIRDGMKPATAMKLGARIAACLDYLHGQGIVHRDLKPENILFRDDSNPILTDFGIAKLLEHAEQVTQQGILLGSPFYLSPEQADYEAEIDGRSDFYSLGVILYELLTGERPFTANSFAAIIMAHRECPVPRMTGKAARYQHIIDKLMAKRPEDRYQNGAELIQAIRQVEKSRESLRKDEAAHAVGKRVPGRFSYKGGFKEAVLAIGSLSLALQVMFGSDKPVVAPVVKQVEVTMPAEVITVKPPQVLITVDAPEAEVVVKQPQPQLSPLEQPQPQQVQSQPSPVEQPISQAKPKVRKAAPAAKPRLSEVDRLFRLAYARMDADRLSLPKGDSALHYFSKILSLEPDNLAAHAGLRQIVRWYARQAEQLLANGNTKRARSYLDRGLAIDEDNPMLLALEQSIQPR